MKETDRELLEWAAKAAGLKLRGWSNTWDGEPGEYGFQLWNFDRWNPCTDDGDAFRLAILLCIGFQYDAFDGAEAWHQHSRHEAKRCIDADDPPGAARLAIVRAAAAIGKAMP